MSTPPVTRLDAGQGILLGEESLDALFGDTGVPTDPAQNPLALLHGDGVKPPMNPLALMQAVKSNGELAAVCHAVANGNAGTTVKIVPRLPAEVGGPKAADPSSWTDEIRNEHRIMQAFVQAGFHGDGAKSLRAGFYEQEHDRVVLGWGGVRVIRSATRRDAMTNLPVPEALGRFEACYATFSKPDVKPTPVPIPVLCEDGTTIWVTEYRYFRKIVFVPRARQGMVSPTASQAPMYYKQYGDWRSLDARTGRRSNSYKYLPPSDPWKSPGTFKPGGLPADGIQAQEVMTWATSFPGVAPYGVSGWHSEMKSVESAKEAQQLVVDFLKSGLHGVILVAASRSMDDALLKQAIDKVENLGRGRNGMGALVTLSLAPMSSDVSSNLPIGMRDEMTADRGRIIFHELSSRLPAEVMDGSIRNNSANSFARAERLPPLLLGKSEAYNFATAQAAWRVVNSLVFSPHHEDRNQFFDRLCVEMGIKHWKLEVVSLEWAEPTPVTGLASVVSQSGGLTPNMGLSLLAESTNRQYVPFPSWWGEVPLPILNTAFASPDPIKILDALGFSEASARIRQVGVAGAATELLNDIATNDQKPDFVAGD